MPNVDGAEREMTREDGESEADMIRYQQGGAGRDIFEAMPGEFIWLGWRRDTRSRQTDWDEFLMKRRRKAEGEWSMDILGSVSKIYCYCQL